MPTRNIVVDQPFDQTQSISAPRIGLAQPSAGSRLLTGLGRSPLQYVVVFLIAFIILFLGMDRGFEYYDEGIILVGAMRVAAGQVPHRDFYANYGPGQFYTLAALFHLFGRYIFVERMYDLIVRSAVVTVAYGIASSYCRRWIAACVAIVCGFWLFSSGLPGIPYPIVPILLFCLMGSMALLPAFDGEAAWHRMVGAGALTGMVALFRYDVGAALLVVQTCAVGIAVWLRQSSRGSLWRKSASVLLPYWLGVAALFLPVALLYLSVAPIHPWVHDIILYPAKYYVRARRLPMPRIYWRALENMALYLPIPVGLMGLSSAFAYRHEESAITVDRKRVGVNQRQSSFLILFGLLSVVFYFKGLVRICVLQMLLALIPMALTLAVLYEFSSRRSVWLHRAVQGVAAVSIFAATWSALKEVRFLYLDHGSVLEELLTPPEPASVRAEINWRGQPDTLHTGLWFLFDPNHSRLVSYLLSHTSRSETVFVGLGRHDRIINNDLLTYFVADRLPATRWSHFDPDLQTRADIQRQMIHEIDAQSVRFIVLEPELNRVIELSNDSSRSSGVKLLDDYIRSNYHPIQKFGDLFLLLRNGASGDAPQSSPPDQ
jgi:hypothetical protein